MPNVEWVSQEGVSNDRRNQMNVNLTPEARDVWRRASRERRVSESSIVEALAMFLSALPEEFWRVAIDIHDERAAKGGPNPRRDEL